MGWGVAQNLFGISVRLGLALAYAVIVGLGAVLGTLVLFFVLSNAGRDRHTASGIFSANGRAPHARHFSSSPLVLLLWPSLSLYWRKGAANKNRAPIKTDSIRIIYPHPPPAAQDKLPYPQCSAPVVPPSAALYLRSTVDTAPEIFQQLSLATRSTSGWPTIWELPLPDEH
jgi:hypothetical protein